MQLPRRMDRLLHFRWRGQMMRRAMGMSRLSRLDNRQQAVRLYEGKSHRARRNYFHVKTAMLFLPTRTQMPLPRATSSIFATAIKAIGLTCFAMHYFSARLRALDLSLYRLLLV